jgi:peroxiredoxin
VSSQLGGQPEATDFRVFVFGKDGELRKQWDNVPAADDLAAVLK